MRIALNSYRFFRRELFQPEMRLVFVSLLLTVTAMATVGLITERIGSALQRQSNELLGADLLVASSRPIPGQWQEKAQQEGLSAARFIEFPSVVITDEDSTLTEVKVVENGYPLRGTIIARNQSGQVPAGRLPASGEAWVENNLLRKLFLKLGDRITLGQKQFTVAAVIEQEPDRGGNLFALAPRVMIHMDDLEATQLIGEGSRVRYRLMIAGNNEQVENYQAWVKSLLGQHYRLQSVRESRPEVNATMDRAERFLALSLVVTLVLSSLATWIAMQIWVKKRLVHAAVLRTLGLTRQQIMQLYTSQLMLLAFIACFLAVLLAYGLQGTFAGVMQSYLAAALPDAGYQPAIVAAFMGLALTLSFSLPAYWQLASTSPMRVLRSLPDQFDSINYSLVTGCLVLALVLGWLTADIKLLAITVGGLLACMLLLLLLAQLILLIVKRFGPGLPHGWHMGVLALVRHRRESLIAMTVFGLSFTFVILLTLIRTDLISQWRDRLPPETPNIFLINIQPSELPGITRWLGEHGLTSIEFSPMVRARLTYINDHKVSGDDYESPRAKRLAKREFNLSWSSELPSHNSLSSGDWWDESRSDLLPQWSVESGIAETLGIKIGDSLTYDAAGRIIKGKVTNLREVSWDSFKVNFFVIGTTPMLEPVPGRFISSFYLPENKRDLMNKMVREYPSVTVLDIDALMMRVRTVIDKVAYAAEAAFIFTLIASTLLIIAMILSSRQVREKENALFRSIGVTRSMLEAAQRIEFQVIGGVSGLVAVVLANLFAWQVSVQLLDIGFRFNFGVAIVVIISGMLLMLMTGWLLLRKQHQLSPGVILRAGQA